MAVRFFLAACVASTASAAIPDLGVFASAPQPVDSTVYGAPSVGNAWATLLSSTNNVLGFNAFVLPPFSAGWTDPVDAVSLVVAGKSVPPLTTIWTPFSVERNGSTKISEEISVSVESEIRMVFESNVVIIRANVTLVNTGAADRDVPLEVNFQTPTRHYPRADLCPSWHYPTQSNPCCWNWFPPQPLDFKDFSYAWAPPSPPSQPASLLEVTDTLSSARGAYALAPLSPASSALSLDPVDLSGSVAQWMPRVPANASLTLAFAAVYCVTNTTAGDAAAAASIVLSQLTEAWAEARSDWQARFEDAFTPGNAHYAGFLPTLSVNPAKVDSLPEAGAQPRASEALQPMEQTYYHSVVSLLANERTNLPVQISGGPCTASVSAAEGPAAASKGRVPGFYNATDATACTNTLPEHIRSVRLGGLSRYLDRHAAAHGLPRACLPDIGGSGSSGRIIFSTGGALNTTVGDFYWDPSYSATALALLHPPFLRDELPRWMGSIDPESGVPSYWSFWVRFGGIPSQGYDYGAQRGIGNYYGANDFSLFSLARAYVAVTGNATWLASPVVQNYPNGSVVTTTIDAILGTLVNHWRYLNTTDFLADYGGAPNLLECVPTYIHYVAGVNAANSWMLHEYADMVEASLSQGTLAERSPASLRADADSIAAAILNRLYVPPNGSEFSGGYFAALYPNGTLQGVRHVMDYVYVSQFLGVNRSADSGGRAYIPPSVAAEMGTFVERELLALPWMRALSLKDPAAPFSNRSDHGPSGAYLGWPPLTMRALGIAGNYSGALSFLEASSYSTTLGAYGQAIEIRPPGLPYKPMVFTLYNALAGFSFTQIIIDTFFGFAPTLNATAPVLADPDSPRGFNGVLSNVRLPGDRGVVSIISDDAGLHLA